MSRERFSSPRQNNYNKVCHSPSIRQVNQITGCGLVSRQCAAVAYDHALVFYLVFKECICQKDESVDRSTREAVFFDLTLRGNFQLMSVCLGELSPSMRESVRKQTKKDIMPYSESKFFSCKFLNARRYLRLRFIQTDTLHTQNNNMRQK